MDIQKNKLKWWQLLIGGVGISVFFHNPLFQLLGDILILVGTGWGVWLGFKYLFNKNGSNLNKAAIIVGILFIVGSIIFGATLVFTSN